MSRISEPAGTCLIGIVDDRLPQIKPTTASPVAHCSIRRPISSRLSCRSQCLMIQAF